MLARHAEQSDTLFQACRKRSGPVWDRFLAPVESAIKDATSYAELNTRLQLLNLPEDQIAALLQNSQISAWSLGAVQVSEEAGLLKGGIGKVVLEPIPPEAAAKWLESKQILDRKVFGEASDAIKARSFSLAKHEGMEIKRAVQEQITLALRDGIGFEDFSDRYKAIMADMGYAPTDAWHLETIFRTNVQTSLNVGRYQRQTDPEVVSLRPYLQYRTVGDGSVRESHAEMDKLTFPVGHPFWDQYYPPNGYNCVVGSTEVQGRFEAALKTRYTGEMVEITTARGSVLTITPNHPIATADNRFVPAGEIAEGDYLLAYVSSVDAELDIGDEQDAPTLAQNVFRVFDHVNPAVELDTVPGDLHGDATFGNGKIDVVALDSELWNDFQSRGSEAVFYDEFGCRCVPHVGLMGKGSLAHALDTVSAAPSCLVGSAGLACSGGIVHARPLESLLVGRGAELDASRYKKASDDGPGNGVPHREAENGLPGVVPADGILDRDAVPCRPMADIDPSGMQGSVYAAPTASGDVECLADMRDRFPGKVAPDAVVSVDRFAFDGHVYDLQSPFGYYIASAIVLSNCRCSVVTLTRRQVKPGQVRDEIPADLPRPDKGFGVNPAADPGAI